MTITQHGGHMKNIKIKNKNINFYNNNNKNLQQGPWGGQVTVSQCLQQAYEAISTSGRAARVQLVFSKHRHLASPWL